jgi:hypothetical protein
MCHHETFLAIRDIFTRSVGCPDCGAKAHLPCIGLSGIFVGLELGFHHLQRLIASNAQWADAVPFIPS